MLSVRGSLAAAGVAMLLAACSAGGSVPPIGSAGALTPDATQSQQALQASKAVAASQSRVVIDAPKSTPTPSPTPTPSGGGSTFTLTAYVNDLAATSTLDIGGKDKVCDPALADAPTYTSSSFTTLTIPAAVTLNECSGYSSTSSYYIVLVDESANDSLTAVAGPATESSNELTFPLIAGGVLSLKSTDTYALMEATGTLTTNSGGGSGSGGDCKQHGGGHDGWGNGWGWGWGHDHGCCDPNGGWWGHGWGYGHDGHDGDDHHHHCDGSGNGDGNGQGNNNGNGHGW